MTFNQYNKNLLISQLKAALEAAETLPVVNSCHTCANFDLRDKPPTCRAAGIAVPPDVIEVGCEGYIYDHTIPPF